MHRNSFVTETFHRSYLVRKTFRKSIDCRHYIDKNQSENARSCSEVNCKSIKFQFNTDNKIYDTIFNILIL